MECLSEARCDKGEGFISSSTDFLFPILFDSQVYLDFVDESFSKVQALRLAADLENKKF